MNKNMLIRPIFCSLLLFTGLFATISLQAQDAEPKIDPAGYILMNNGISIDYETDSIKPEEQREDFYAPLEIEFRSNIYAADSLLRFSEWRFYDGENVEPSYRRTDENTTWSFNQSGNYRIQLYVKLTDEDGKEVFSDDQTWFLIHIPISKLIIPNAFSPNGDGINDIFKVGYESIVKFNAYVFNRWGQQLYHWGIDQIDSGWDGSYKGKQVKDGVYFIVIEAEGSDGKKYKHKGDINILRGTKGAASGPETE